MKTEQKPLPYLLEGNLASNSLLIFLHGYPDNMHLWDSLVSELISDHTILRISYPNFDPSVKRSWGVSFEVIIEGVKQIIDETQKQKERKKTLVMHDFGALIGYMFDEKYPGYLNDIIAMDIGLGRDTRPFLKMCLAFFLTIFYQWFLMTAFLIGGKIGNLMTRGFISFIKKGGYTPINEKEINSSFNYMYYYLLKRVISGIFNKKKRLLSNYKPSCPMAYIFGLNKPFMFHSEKFLQKLMNEPKCEVHGVKGGHWVMFRHKAQILDIIQRRTKN